ncbi:hypothetical protein L596_026493 [Steinernema carpocapsae]|uniref:Uncharacterized protein n=1 Tax=Steinernema carpocapsae TaxID=34508 RepID=A0A4U5M1I8_STECR|nr:hypothetical protein L596_026493 [Steinernema carpocapsae]
MHFHMSDTMTDNLQLCCKCALRFNIRVGQYTTPGKCWGRTAGGDVPKRTLPLLQSRSAKHKAAFSRGDICCPNGFVYMPLLKKCTTVAKIKNKSFEQNISNIFRNCPSGSKPWTIENANRIMTCTERNTCV